MHVAYLLERNTFRNIAAVFQFWIFHKIVRLDMKFLFNPCRDVEIVFERDFSKAASARVHFNQFEGSSFEVNLHFESLSV